MKFFKGVSLETRHSHLKFQDDPCPIVGI